MKKICIYLLSSLLLFSCSDDFLKENDIPVLEATFVVSPGAPEQTFPIYWSKAGNAKLSIASLPSWLKLVSISENFENGTAYITCYATPNSAFSKTGIYYDMMSLHVDGAGECRMRVAYAEAGNPIIQLDEFVAINYNSYDHSSYLTVSNQGDGLLVWYVAEYPEWIVVNSQGSNYSNTLQQHASGGVSLSINPEYLPVTEELSGNIVVVSNDKNRPLIAVEVDVVFGNPSLSCYTDNLNFERGVSTRELYFSNYGDGPLKWRVSGLPEWLSVSDTSGSLASYGQKTLTFSCDRTKMAVGVNSATIYLKTNDRYRGSYPITVTAKAASANSANVRLIEGSVAGAWYNRQTDVLYIATAQPNRLVAYDTKSKAVVQELNLPQASTSLAVAEDGSKAAVGHSGAISAVNLTDFTLIKTVEISHNVYDIAWTDGDNYCYTQKGGSFTAMHSVNMATGGLQDYQENYTEADGATNVRKVPSKPYVIAARRETGPTGIIVYDVNAKNRKNYLHQSIGKFWFSPDGKYMVDSYRGVYKVDDLLTYSDFWSLSPVKTLNVQVEGYYYSGICWMDYSRSLWVMHDGKIDKLDVVDYNISKTFYHVDYYTTTAGAEKAVEGKYVFAGSDESQLTVIGNLKDTNTWVLEFMSVAQ